MKKNIFLSTIAITVFSISVFSQSNANRVEQTLVIPVSAPIFKAQAELQVTHHNNTFKAKPHEIHKPINHSEHKVASFVAIYDSVYYWNWDTNISYWPNQAINKYVNMIYDSHQNLINQTYQLWNGTAWVNDQLYTFTFDANNNETGYFVQDWTGSAWVNSYQYIYTYDAQNNGVSDLSQTWSGLAWTNINQSLYTYDANNNEILDTYQTWNGSAWTNVSQNIFTYNANNTEANETQQTWSGSAWTNTYVYYYTYNANKYETNETDQKWTGSAWVNTYQYTYTYDANNNCITNLSQSWTGSAWVNNDLYTYAYNANNAYISAVEQVWSGSAWALSAQTVYAYDANNNMTSEIDESWIGIWVANDEYVYTYNANNYRIWEDYQTWIGSGWVNTTIYGYTFDADNADLSFSEKDYDVTGTKVISGDSSYNYLHEVLGVNSLSARQSNISVYPNPSNGKFTIQWSALTDHSYLRIYNTASEQVISLNLSEKTNEVDLSKQGGGFYLYRVVDGSGQLIGTGKIVVEK